MQRLTYVLLATSALALLAGCNDFKMPLGDKKADTAVQSPADPAALEAAARLKAEGKLKEAANAYSQIVARDPKSVPASLELAILHRKLGEPEKSLALLRAIQSQASDNPQVLAQLGYTLVDLNEPRAAIDIFDQLMAIKNNYPDAYNGKGVAFDHLGNHAVAQDLYRHALMLSPGAPHIQNNLAMSLIMDGKAKEAITFLEPIYEQDKNNKIIRHNLAMAYGITGNDKKAMELNLTDLNKEQAEENLRYYKEFARRQKLVAKNNATIKDTLKPEPMPAPVEAAATPAPVPATAEAAPAAVVAAPEPQPPADTAAKAQEISPAAGTPIAPEEKSFLDEMLTPQYAYPAGKR